MIRSFRHAGIERFFLTGNKAGIQPHHANKLSLQLTTLNRARKLADMAAPGWKLHALTGNLKEHWAVQVSGSWRLTFRFEEEDAILVDYQDRH